MNVGEVLKSIRKGKKLTQQVVCKKVKLSQTFLSQIEGGSKEPSPTMFRKLCKHYGVPYQVVVWKSITEKDVDKEKRHLFNTVLPAINNLIDEFVKI